MSNALAILQTQQKGDKSIEWLPACIYMTTWLTTPAESRGMGQLQLLDGDRLQVLVVPQKSMPWQAQHVCKEMTTTSAACPLGVCRPSCSCLACVAWRLDHWVLLPRMFRPWLVTRVGPKTQLCAAAGPYHPGTTPAAAHTAASALQVVPCTCTCLTGVPHCRRMACQARGPVRQNCFEHSKQQAAVLPCSWGWHCYGYVADTGISLGRRC